MRLSLLTRVLCVFAVAITCWSSTTTVVTAQAVENPCNCQADVTRNIAFCVNGTTYTAKVVFCENNYNPPDNGPCTNLLQDRVSTIKSICFDSTLPIGQTANTIIGSLLGNIANTGCNLGNQWGIVVPNNSVFCWVISVPKCTIFTGACVVPCETCQTCTYLYRWRRVNGLCVFDDLTSTSTCPETQDCNTPSPCEQGCPQRVFCN